MPLISLSFLDVYGLSVGLAKLNHFINEKKFTNQKVVAYLGLTDDNSFTLILQLLVKSKIIV